MYLSPEILNWRVSIGTHVEHDRKLGVRSYEIWAHAEQLLAQALDDYRVSGITTMWRAIDHRIRLLERIYSLKNIPIKDKPNDPLNLLEYLGIVRPLMLQKLKEIRNAVEHEDMSPPSSEDCNVLLEFTWYFLRSTDGMVQRMTTHLLLELTDTPNEGADYWLDIDHAPFSNWIMPELVSNQPKDNWFALKVEHTETRDVLVSRLKDQEDKESIGESGRGKNPEDIYIRGEIRGPSDSLKKLTKLFLGVM
jgi:hypothetical protein